MGDGSIESKFQFESYKIDFFQYEMEKAIELLSLTDNIDPSNWNYNLRVRKPVYFQERQIYITGLEMTLKCTTETEEEEEINGEKQKKDLISINAGVAGIFKVNSKMPEELENKLTKIQGPALLLPYLRSTITSFLATAGFGTWVFPLINIHELVKQQEDKLELQVK